MQHDAHENQVHRLLSSSLPVPGKEHKECPSSFTSKSKNTMYVTNQAASLDSAKNIITKSLVDSFTKNSGGFVVAGWSMLKRCLITHLWDAPGARPIPHRFS